MKPYAGTRRHPPSSPFKSAAPVRAETYVVDEQVTHDKYGLGRVVGVDGDRSVTVDFGSSRISLPTPFHKLSKLSDMPAASSLQD